VEEADLVDALKNGRLRAAGLDVYGNEPIDANHLLTKLDNVVLSGHVAWYFKEAILTLPTEAAKEVVRVLPGERPQNWVNPWNERP
jgi:phosphoglycerate dehydrogenase-like enzyme